MKLKQIIIVGALSLMGLITFYVIKTVYSVLQISAVFPPMKEYMVSLSTDRLLKEINNIDKKDSNLVFKITDTTGTLKIGLKYYANVYFKNNTASYTFHFFYEESDKEHSKIGLIGVFDNSHNIGSYQVINKDIQNLINIFEDNFVDKINNGSQEKENTSANIGLAKNWQTN